MSDDSDHARKDVGCLSQLIHASAVLIGPTAVIVRGASGSGKSALVLDLLAAVSAQGRFGMLIGDDQVRIEPAHGRLIVRAAPVLVGLIERRGSGIIQLAHEPAGVVGLIVDLGPDEPDRMPEPSRLTVDIAGVTVRRIEITGFGAPRIQPVLSALSEITADR